MQIERIRKAKHSYHNDFMTRMYGLIFIGLLLCMSAGCAKPPCESPANTTTVSQNVTTLSAESTTLSQEKTTDRTLFFKTTVNMTTAVTSHTTTATTNALTGENSADDIFGEVPHESAASTSLHSTETFPPITTDTAEKSDCPTSTTTKKPATTKMEVGSTISTTEPEWSGWY